MYSSWSTNTTEHAHMYIYGDDQSARVPQREFQPIGPIIRQNVMIFLSIIFLI